MYLLTIANPDNRADVLEEALSFALASMTCVLSCWALALNMPLPPPILYAKAAISLVL